MKKTGRQGQGSSRNGFIIAMLCAVALAFLCPSPGAKGGWMHPELLNNAGVALILFVQGLAMAVERMKAGASNWRLHLIVQSFTFLLFPIVGLAFHEMTRIVWPSEPSALRELVPFAVGMGIRPLIRKWVDANGRWLNILSNGIILFIVYTAFCDSVEGRIWEHYGIGLTVKVLAGVIALFTTVSLFVWAISNAASLGRDDFIAALFCSVKKTLAMGVPLAHLIFGAKNLGLILMPILFYHPFQLFVCGLLASRFSNQSCDVPVGETSPMGQT